MSRIASVELSSFRFEMQGLGLPSHGAAGVGNLIAKKGERLPAQRWAVRIETDDGARGEYVTHWVGTPSSFGQASMLAPHLIGRDPDAREEIWQDLRREVRAYDHMGHGPLDIALWDLAGKRRNVSVARLLGAFRTTLPVYASTYHGQDEPGGLDTPRAFADYAVSCKQRGFAGFKIHGWHNGDIAREISTIAGVRKAVGDDWPLMIDPASQLRTWRDALKVGEACDEADFFWYEDPYRDTGGAVEGHKRLRERLKTPLLVCEHVRGLEAKAAFILGGGGDLIHADPEYEWGHRRAEDRPFLSGARHRRAIPCLRPRAPRRDGGDAKHAFLRDGADRTRHAEHCAAGLSLRLFGPAGRASREWLRPRSRQSRPWRHL